MYIEDGVIKTINVAATEDDPAGDDNPTATLVEKMLEDIPEPAGGPIAIEVETILSPELQAEIDAEDVVMFSLDGCPFCKKAEEALADANIKFKRVEIGPFKAALKDKTGKTSAPSTWVKGTYVGGCNDGVESWHGVIPMLASGKMSEMLK
jgi:glutaredoxin